MTKPSSRVWRLGTFVFVVIAALAVLSVCVRPEKVLGDKPLSEDGFYALAVARHLAAGHGLTIDGEHWTSGIQPLFTVLCALPFWLTGGDRFVALRGVLLLHAITFLLAAWLLGLVARDAREEGRDDDAPFRRWLTTLLYLGSGYVFLQSFNGLETGFSILMFIVAWRRYQQHGIETARDRATFGALLGLSVLARVDAIFAVMVATVGAAFLARARPREGVIHALQIAIPAGIVSAPWWLYNRILFGAWMPSGGRAQQQLGFTVEKVKYLFNAISLAFTPEVHLARFESAAGYAVRAAVAILIAVLLARSFRRAPNRPSALTRRTLQFAAGLLLTYLLLAIFYGYQSGARQFYSRYLAPLSLLAIPAAALVLTDLKRGRAVVAVATGALAVAQTSVIAYSLWTMRFAQSNHMYTDQLALIEKHVPAGEAVAAFQSGTIGYFRDRVINLDGKVNAEAMAERERLGAYLESRGARWYCDWFFFSKTAEDQARWKLVETRGDFQLYRRAD